MSTADLPESIDGPERAESRLWSAFERAPRLRRLARSLGVGAMEVEHQAHSVYRTWQLDEVTGPQLDVWGAILGVARGGRNDTLYRSAIATELAIARSQGTRPEVAAIVRDLHLATEPARILDMLLAAVSVEVVAPLLTLGSLDRPTLRASIQRSLLGGVRLDRVVLVDDQTLTLDSDDLGLDAGRLADSY